MKYFAETDELECTLLQYELLAHIKEGVAKEERGEEPKGMAHTFLLWLTKACQQTPEAFFSIKGVGGRGSKCERGTQGIFSGNCCRRSSRQVRVC